MRLNPQKCVFVVSSGKLLGYVISMRGIEIDPYKIKDIADMPPPKSEKQIRGFLGKLQYINSFISNLTMTCKPIFKKLKKRIKMNGMNSVKLLLNKIKEYLSKPLILSYLRQAYLYAYI